ncbi:hypothetical protein H5410_047718 [Solanum commersonii]|uniref:Uncharacterized protein n=1 Tax=Solanum commersonii TaxID=4109 RepID=A0A9J5XJ29_SOLCO|nr:hypothetical protein H5410_047718 [Solanum commersonii]
MLTSFVTGTGKAFPKLNTLNCAFFFFSPPLPVLFSNVPCTSKIVNIKKATADKRDLVDLKSGEKIVNIDNTYVLQWPVTYKNLRASKVGGSWYGASRPQGGEWGCSGHGASMPGGVVGCGGLEARHLEAWGWGFSRHGRGSEGGGLEARPRPWWLDGGLGKRCLEALGWGRGPRARCLEAWGWGWGFSRHAASRGSGVRVGVLRHAPRGPGDGVGVWGMVPRGSGWGGGLGARCLEAWGWG